MHRYQKVDASPIDDPENCAQDVRTKPICQRLESVMQKPALLLVNLGLFMTSLLILWASTEANACNSVTTTHMLRKVSTNSPIFDRIDIGLVDKPLNATLLPSPHDEILRGDPSPELDKAWQRIANTAPVALTRKEMLAAGFNLSKIVKYPESYGLGEAYAARIDVFHQLHCLDALRQEAYWNYYRADIWPDLEHSTPMHRAHLSHCVYYLAQNIMCQGSVDVYAHTWTDTLKQPYPDFNRMKKCRNFDAILAWQEQNSLDEEKFYKLRRPAEFGEPWHMSDEFKRMWVNNSGWNEEALDHHGDQIG